MFCKLYNVCDVFPYSVEQTCWMCGWMILNSYFLVTMILGSFLPNLYFDYKIIINSRPLGCTCSHGVVTNWSYALAEFLVSSRFSFPGNSSNVHIANVF